MYIPVSEHVPALSSLCSPLSLASVLLPQAEIDKHEIDVHEIDVHEIDVQN